MKPNSRFDISQCLFVSIAFTNDYAIHTERISDVTVCMFLDYDLELPDHCCS